MDFYAKEASTTYTTHLHRILIRQKSTFCPRRQFETFPTFATDARRAAGALHPKEAALKQRREASAAETTEFRFPPIRAIRIQR